MKNFVTRNSLYKHNTVTVRSQYFIILCLCSSCRYIDSYTERMDGSMKRRYLALMLGLALSALPLNALAEETEGTEAVTIEITDSESESEDSEEAVIGQVVSIDDSSITIELGNRKNTQTEGMPAEEPTEETTDEDQTEGTDDAAAENQAEGTDAEEAGNDILPEGKAEIELTGEESTLTITENTEFFYEVGDSADLSTMEETTGESEAAEDSQEETEDESAAAVDASAGSEAEAATEAAALSDIQTGDLVIIALDEEGNAATVTVMTGAEVFEGGTEESPDASTEESQEGTEAAES